MSKNVTIDGIEYAPIKPAKGARAVVVVGHGWIFVGEVERKDGRITLRRASHVCKWESIGFAKTVETGKVDLRPIDDVDIPAHAEIFCIPVADKWGCDV